MKKTSITYKGAYHQIMHRGIKGGNIFSSNSLKQYFLKFLRDKSEKFNIRLLSYCITGNHYFMVLQNSSGKLSDFMRELNSRYAIHYRKKESKKGHVFQKRYNSVLILEDSNLTKSIMYVLLYPVAQGIVDNPYNYRWSSIRDYFSDKKDGMVDKGFVEEIFQSKSKFNKLLEELQNEDLYENKTGFGYIIGGENFEEETIEDYIKRKNKGGEAKNMEEISHMVSTIDIVVNLFDNKKIIKANYIETQSGKESKVEFLDTLKDKASLLCKEITDIPIFHHLKGSSLGQLYKRAKDKFLNMQ
jgi:putative transposase